MPNLFQAFSLIPYCFILVLMHLPLLQPIKMVRTKNPWNPSNPHGSYIFLPNKKKENRCRTLHGYATHPIKHKFSPFPLNLL